ncbi:hypothetical protein Moror_11430 [Moniliophthora roreri MCA 2997]|uniref:Uncharacterized protein n=1 Tax=Moniliophthora roreri (strain MCA 2997) TaxID=1381753 RepID=V2WBG5_MONRO|nr:hypothetical protein Moror_11430 [Moniliophthora roreri MCA 2997]
MTRSSREYGALSTPEHSPSTSTRRSKVITSVRRSLSVTPKKSRSTSDKNEMHYSNAEERTYTASRIRRDDPSRSPPTVEQIAMGLHLSRTPHLRNAPAHQHRLPSITLPPPPARSSLKKFPSEPSNPGMTPSVSSATTFTSLSTPQSSLNMNSDASSSSSALFSLKMSSRMMSRFLPRSRSSTSSTSLHMSVSPRPSISSDSSPSIITQKKAVRFSEPGNEE